jgi:hypothetical protein
MFIRFGRFCLEWVGGAWMSFDQTSSVMPCAAFDQSYRQLLSATAFRLSPLSRWTEVPFEAVGQQQRVVSLLTFEITFAFQYCMQLKSTGS